MQLTSILLLVGLLQVSASGLSQQKISLTKHQSSLENIITDLRKQSGYDFVYSNKVLQKAIPVTVSFEGASLKEALERCFKDQPLTYSVVDKTVVISIRRTANPTLPRRDTLLTVTGRVTDENNNPLVGVTVSLKGTHTGTNTDTSGTYTFEVQNPNGTLVFSYVGYTNREVPINGQSKLNVQMEASVSSLDQIVVVGYGTQKKKDLTGAVSSVSSDVLTAYPAAGAVQALQGRAAGVSVQSVNGQPGGSFKIRVRGATSINANSDPLFVVDGFVGGIVPPPEDIASIEVLKDASATAIYGSRAANGVVMITTKSGQPGRLAVSLSSSYSLQQEMGRLELLNAHEFAAYINEARNSDFYNLDSIKTNTDWQDLIFRSGYTQKHQLSLSGGSETVKYYVSGSYFDQQGVIKNSGFDRLSLASNLRFEVSNSIHVIFNSIIESAKSSLVPTQSGGGATNEGVVTAAERFDPNLGILDKDGKYTTSKVGIAAFANPMSILDGRQQNSKRDNLQVNVKGVFDLTEDLVFNSTFGMKIQNQHGGTYSSHITNTGINADGLGHLSYARSYSYLTEQYLNYRFNPTKSTLDLTAGYSHQKFKNESFAASSSGFITDALGYWNLGVGTNLLAPSSDYSGSQITSFYGRLNYNYDSRYLLTFTARYDGASQFSEGHKWSFFPSGAFSWNVSNEPFYPQNTFLSVLKFRTSYGLTGNQAIGPYQSLSRLASIFFLVNNESVSAVHPKTMANKDLTWETTAQFDVGLDLGLLQGRVNITGDYYFKKTHGLLFSVPIASFSGYSSRLENLGEIENSGVELNIISRNLTHGLEWTTDFSLTMNRNKVLSLPNGNDIIYSSVPTFSTHADNAILREGEPVGAFYGFVYDGVYQEGDHIIAGGSFDSFPGGARFSDLNKDGILDDKDRKVIGNPHPKALWGLNNDFSYKNFSVNLFFQAATGGDVLNLVKMELDRLSGNTNATKDALDRWTPTHTNTNVPSAHAGRTLRTSTRFVEDGSYVRLKNVSLGYNFSADFTRKLNIHALNIYVSGQNLLTFTNYSGVDPEVAYQSSNRNLGLDFGSYPKAISYTVGLKLKF